MEVMDHEAERTANRFAPREGYATGGHVHHVPPQSWGPVGPNVFYGMHFAEFRPLSPHLRRRSFDLVRQAGVSFREIDRTISPAEVAPLLLDAVRRHRDENGELANALPDDLREALRLAAVHLEEKDAEIARLRAAAPTPHVLPRHPGGG